MERVDGHSGVSDNNMAREIIYRLLYDLVLGVGASWNEQEYANVL